MHHNKTVLFILVLISILINNDINAQEKKIPFVEPSYEIEINNMEYTNFSTFKSHPDDVLKIKIDVNYYIEFPNEIFEFKNLKVLILENFVGTKPFPENFDKFENLEELYIISCWELEELPKTLKTLKKLRTLMIDDCDELSNSTTNDIIYSLKNLETLYIYVTDGFELSDKISELNSLRVLSVTYEFSKLPKDFKVKIPDGILNLKLLRVLHFEVAFERIDLTNITNYVGSRSALVYIKNLLRDDFNVY